MARVLLALVGVGLLVSVVQHVGLDVLVPLLTTALPWMPLALLLEAARIGCDAVASASVLGPHWRRIGAWRLFLAHVAGHGVMNLMPGGRGAAELVKAGLFYEVLGVSEAGALGTTNQANVLIASALFSLPCALAAWWTSPAPALTLAILAHAVVLFGSGVGLRVMVESPAVERFVRRRLPRMAEGFERYQRVSRAAPKVGAAPVGWMMLGRGAQTVQYAVLAHAVGLTVGPVLALTVQGTNLVAAAVGVLVPGQVGSAEGVFMLAAEALGTTPARATSIALLAHASGITWTALGLAILFFWRAPKRAETAAPAP